MGPGSGAMENDLQLAFDLGKRLGEEDFIVLTGGRSSGVMEAALKGAKAGGGTTVGILPSEHGAEQSEYVDIPVKTGMGSARNNINVLTADVIAGIGIGAGTTSEIALAIKANKPVLLLSPSPNSETFFMQFDHSKLVSAKTPAQALVEIKRMISSL